MDLVKIGKYIAAKRKEKGMTQKQLAEKLGMSDKSVSKWERGICLPDVSVYTDLCQNLGISINEFLAGEDIAQENIAKNFEENIIGVATDSKNRQKRLKAVILTLFMISVIMAAVLTEMVLRTKMPENVIAPVDRDSVEMKTAEMLAGVDGAFMYNYTTTDSYESLILYVSTYHSGKLVNKEQMEIGYQGIGSPQNGTILIMPDFADFSVKLIIADEMSKLSTKRPILENVWERQYYGRSASEITESTEIKYDEEQPLLALIYDNDQMSVSPIEFFAEEEENTLTMNDYIYYFSYRFVKNSN